MLPDLRRSLETGEMNTVCVARDRSYLSRQILVVSTLHTLFDDSRAQVQILRLLPVVSLFCLMNSSVCNKKLSRKELYNN